MSSSRVEINFRRLLSKCESMVADSTSFDWRTENYVESLQQQLLELCNQPSSSTPELLTEYTRRVDFLNGLVKADRLPSASEKALASQLLVPSHMPNRERLTATEELHLQKTSHYTQQMRDELLGRTDGSPGGGLRHRGRQKEKEEEEEGTEDIDVLLRHHERAQEKLAEEMLTFAQTLKHNSLAAHHIITDDTKVLAESQRQAEVNTTKLRVESERLAAHAHKSYSWWFVIMIVLVCMTFVWMVGVIKFKRKST